MFIRGGNNSSKYLAETEWLNTFMLHLLHELHLLLHELHLLHKLHLYSLMICHDKIAPTVLVQNDLWFCPETNYTQGMSMFLPNQHTLVLLNVYA